MTKQQALKFLTQVAQDFIATLPMSARESFRREAQDAINALLKTDDPPKADAP